MERNHLAVNGVDDRQLVADSVSFARSYQLEALEKALKQNTVVFLETGTGKTLIAIMLLRSYAHMLRKPSPFIAVFLVPTVVLVNQQGGAIMMHTDLKVGKYYGELGVDYWDAATWKQEKDKNEVLVMTPQILLDALRHSFLRLDQIKVLIFDECHNARGKHPYACIMTEFYHRKLQSNDLQLPRVFGMTASPIKAKASSSASAYWNQIRELENLMNAKVFTCDSDSVLAQYVSFSTPKVKMYKEVDIPYTSYKRIADDLRSLVEKHEHPTSRSSISQPISESLRKRLHNVWSTFMFCSSELGIWLAMKAAEVLSLEESDIFSWGKFDVSGQKIIRDFSLDAVKVFSRFIPDVLQWSIRDDITANMNAGYLSSKVVGLVETLLSYRELKDLRCIVFVERIVTAIVIRSLLNEFFPQLNGWRAEYTAGSNSRFQCQSRKEQNTIIDGFRKGTVNIIVATSMLEEGLDVQSCNLVIRFDPSATVCSFIQSRGRARMHNSDFVLMVKSGDNHALDRVKNYLSSVNTMRSECLSHASIPCEPLDESYDEPCYQVESTGAIVTLTSSVALLHFYCSRLPSDGYFKPDPRCTIDKETATCTLQLPNSCPIQIIKVKGNIKSLKQSAYLEACKRLHQVGELTDNLVPNTMEEEADNSRELGSEPFVDECSKYLPPEVVSYHGKETQKLYHCYLIELKQKFEYEIQLQDVVLAVPTRLGHDIETLEFDLDADKGEIIVKLKYIEHMTLTSKQIAVCRRFQITVFNILLDQNLNKLLENLVQYSGISGPAVLDYLLLPSLGSKQKISIDWKYVSASLYLQNGSLPKHTTSYSTEDCGRHMQTKNGLVCSCMLENSLVYTPHNGFIYCVTDFWDGSNGNTYLDLGDGETISYKEYYRRRHGIVLQFEAQTLLKAKRIFRVHNYLQRGRIRKTKEPSNYSYELPPELCSIILSPISISTLYSFSFIPSVMHRIESFLIAASLKSMPADINQKFIIPTLTVLEAITTKKCQEKIHLESLETLGDSFLKYAASQQLFKTYQNQHEGLLSLKREKIICNENLCKLGCARKIMGFIRNEPFDPKTWIIPGSNITNHALKEEMLSSKKMYSMGSRKIKSKTVADVVEALIGAFLLAGGEMTAFSFMSWLGIKVDFVDEPYTRKSVLNPERYVNIKYFESILKYNFNDVSLLVEALTHGSYMLPVIPRCYQRLEFLGDAVLDYLITKQLYHNYPGLSPGLLTDLRSASTNNDFYAQSAVKVEIYKHILHASNELHRQIVDTVHKFEELSSVPTFGWESETSFPKVLGDIIESLAGAIFIDSGYNLEIVFQSMRPLIGPVITPETLKLHPIRELSELCQKECYTFKKTVVSHNNGVSCVTVEVEANGVVYKNSSSVSDRKTAKKLACKNVLKSLKRKHE